MLGDTPLLGGIGQANAGPGFAAGRNFYLVVDDLTETIRKTVDAGGSDYIGPVTVDGYHVAMVKDLEAETADERRRIAPPGG